MMPRAETILVRAGRCESHMDMFEEPLCMGIYRKERHMNGHVRRPILCGNSQEKAPHLSGARILCRNLQEKLTWTCHKSHLVWKSTGKMLHTLSGVRILSGNLKEDTGTPVPT